MIKEKIKSLIEIKTKGGNKKTVENLIVFLILLIVTVISINVIWGEEEKVNNSNSTTQDEYKVLAKESNKTENLEYNLEKELEDILSKISGVGKVQVLITYSQTKEVIAMQNEDKSVSRTEETDSNRWYKNN